MKLYTIIYRDKCGVTQRQPCHAATVTGALAQCHDMQNLLNVIEHVELEEIADENATHSNSTAQSNG